MVELAVREEAATEVADYPESGVEVLRRTDASSPVEMGGSEGSLVAETEFREVFYSRHGAFGQQWVDGGEARWLDPLLPSTLLPGASLSDWLSGASLHLSSRSLPTSQCSSLCKIWYISLVSISSFLVSHLLR